MNNDQRDKARAEAYELILGLKTNLSLAHNRHYPLCAENAKQKLKRLLELAQAFNDEEDDRGHYLAQSVGIYWRDLTNCISGSRQNLEHAIQLALEWIDEREGLFDYEKKSFKSDD